MKKQKYRMSRDTFVSLFAEHLLRLAERSQDEMDEFYKRGKTIDEREEIAVGDDVIDANDVLDDPACMSAIEDIIWTAIEYCGLDDVEEGHDEEC